VKRNDLNRYSQAYHQTPILTKAGEFWSQRSKERYEEVFSIYEKDIKQRELTQLRYSNLMKKHQATPRRGNAHTSKTK
jgi:hypothetical protein